MHHLLLGSAVLFRIRLTTAADFLSLHEHGVAAYHTVFPSRNFNNLQDLQDRRRSLILTVTTSKFKAFPAKTRNVAL